MGRSLTTVGGAPPAYGRVIGVITPTFAFDEGTVVRVVAQRAPVSAATGPLVRGARRAHRDLASRPPSW